MVVFWEHTIAFRTPAQNISNTPPNQEQNAQPPLEISADPCRQQGERVREEITSNKCCAVQVRGKRGGDRKRSQVQSKKPKKGSEKGGAVSANVASERSTKQEVRSKNAEARVNERHKVTFGTLGYGPRARSVLRCHGVLVLRHGPPRGGQSL